MSGGDTLRICVLGAGGIGAPIAALLTKAGRDVTIVDQWVEHVEAMKRGALTIDIGTRQQPEGQIRVEVNALHPYELAARRPSFGMVLLAAKSYDTNWLVKLIGPYLGSSGALVSVQNSMNEEWIAPIIGSERVLGCVLTGGGELLSPGHAWRNRSIEHHYYTVGSMTGDATPALKRAAEVLSDAGRTTLTTNLLGAKWSKVVHNSMGSALSALAGRRIWELLDVEGFLPRAVQAGREAIQVGNLLGYRLEPIFGMSVTDWLARPEDAIADLIRSASRGASEGSMNMVQQEIARGRPSEVVGYLNGLVVQRGLECGVPTPINRSIVDVFRRLERGQLQPDVANIELVATA